ncbi:cation:proton antiporter [Solwaraspora sp. WMMD1047]|uniref:cation:proton antiporter domain-containing protein n=1 Tax=Solwaraspora sp. WMMD1047 TaxID=3016102 RepID=UPI002416AA73|nr:cation:proton antiporter [Solwaraspora sp. WMMD1047]MDG4830320.1 cation:proton antiporter [Solwaraspora sp. WMMD1047]
MALDVILAAAGTLGVVVAALSGRLRRMPLSAPMLALFVGVLLGPELTGVLDVPVLPDGHAGYEQVARFLLAISVMAVALRFPVRQIRRETGSVLLLLLVGMLGMTLVTGAAAALILGLPLAVAALLGAALSPTDPVLASSAVSGDPAEGAIPLRSRLLLSLESGANDGLALPVVVIAVALAGSDSLAGAGLTALWQVLAAIVIGAGLGAVGGWALRAGQAHGATEAAPALLFTLLLAFGVLGVAGLAKTDGVLAVFVAGLVFNAMVDAHERGGSTKADDAINRFLSIPLFLLLGAALPWSDWRDLGWRGVALVTAVLLLRRIPLLMLLRRPLRLGRPDAIYLGWFGPVGVSAFFYLMLEAGRLDVDRPLVAAGALVVAASVVAHGLTAAAGLRLYRHATGGRTGGPDAG